MSPNQKNIVNVPKRARQRQTGRQTDRQTDRDREKGRDTERETERERSGGMAHVESTTKYLFFEVKIFLDNF